MKEAKTLLWSVLYPGTYNSACHIGVTPKYLLHEWKIEWPDALRNKEFRVRCNKAVVENRKKWGEIITLNRELRSCKPQNMTICVYIHIYSFPGGSVVKNLPANAGETQVRSLGREDPLVKAMATHSSVLAWEIPWTEEPGGLQSMGSQTVGHDLMTKQTNKYVYIYIYFRRERVTRLNAKTVYKWNDCLTLCKCLSELKKRRQGRTF